MARGPGRPELYPIRKLIQFDQAMLDAIKGWRQLQHPIPTVSEAIRVLVGMSLASEAAKPAPAPEKPASAPKRTRPKSAPPKKPRKPVGDVGGTDLASPKKPRPR
jgi:hypothetical protein